MTFYDFLVETLLVCKKTFGADFEALSAEEKQALILRITHDLMQKDPLLAQQVARMYMEDVKGTSAE